LAKAHFTIGVRAHGQPKSSIPIGAEVEISPKGFILGVKAELKTIFAICPKLLINAKLCGLVLAQGWKKDTIKFLKPICNPMFQLPTFVNILTSMLFSSRSSMFRLIELSVWF